MKIYKSIFVFLLTMFVIFAFSSFKINAEISLVPLEKTSGSGYVKYRGTSTNVMIPSEYTQQQSDFRAVWISPLVGDIGHYINDAVIKRELTSVLDIIESYNMNVIVYHIRIMHDALYDSDLNITSSYIPGANFERWDYLEWFISEAHRRGIEFHAWLNPYRITNSTITSKSSIISKYSNDSNNPASKAENIIIGTKGAILNPGEPEVRSFLIDTCMEIITKYDVDAIHFDDYFYASMPSNADIDTYNKYRNTSQTTNISDWRREQIDLFIKQLSTTMRLYNQSTNRNVQLGIAPTGIWNNGNGQVTYASDGTAITSGSNTAGQTHYSNYLFCDTKKWLDNEWIDYIIPQSYWSFELPAAPYADVVDWWAKVVKYKNVNLYTGMGLYRHHEGDAGGSWESNLYEASNQVLYNTKHEEIKGLCIFNYKYIKDARANPGMKKVLDEYWINPVKTPIINTMEAKIPSEVSGLKLNRVNEDSFVLSWDVASDARKYLIYASNSAIDYADPNQVIAIVGANQNGDCLYEIKNTPVSNYGVVSISATGHTSEAANVSINEASLGLDIDIAKFSKLSYSGIIAPNNLISFNFIDADVYVGEELEYTVQISTDNINFQSLDGRLNESNKLYIFLFTYPNTLDTRYIRVVGTNGFGTVTSSSVLLNMNINAPSDLLEFAKELLEESLDSILFK